MTQLISSIGQKCIGNPVLVLRDADGDVSRGEYLAWTGTDSRLNFANRETGGSFASSVFGTNKSEAGPALVLTSDEMTAYYVFSDKDSKNLGIATLVRNEPSSRNWSLKNTSLFSGTNITGTPSALIATQNGKLCLNLAWCDGADNSIKIGQAYLVGAPGSAISFSQVLTLPGRKCNKGVSLIRDGQHYILAYFQRDSDNLRLAHSTDAFFVFPESRDCVLEIKSQTRPEVLRVEQDVLVVISNLNSKIFCAVLGRAADGKYHVAGQREIDDAAIAQGAPPSGRVRQRVKDGLTERFLSVAWCPTNNGDIKYIDRELGNIPYIPIS